MVFLRSLALTVFVLLSPMAQALDAVPGEFIVRYKSSGSVGALGKTTLNNNLKLIKSWGKINTFQFKTRNSRASQMDLRDQEEVLRELREDPNVIYAEPNYYVKAQDIFYKPTGAPIKAPESWQEVAASPNKTTVVAVLDSGLNTEHSFFKNTGRLWTNRAEVLNGKDDDGNGYIDDIHGWNFIANNNDLSDQSQNGHGTHVAGIVIASGEDLGDTNNATSRIQVMPLKFLDGDGIGKTSDAINAIYYALNNGATVLNNSWGGPGYSRSLHEAVVTSFRQGALFVAAAGNESSNNDTTPIYPANLDVPNVISVGASTDGDGQAYFSNYGVDSVDLMAPGMHIISADKNGGEKFLSGTSMAAPFVSGIAALMHREAQQFTGYQLKEDLMESVDVLSAYQNSNSTSGRVNFLKAMQKTQSHSGDAAYLPDYTPNYQGSRDLASLSGDEAGAGCGRVKELYKEQNQNFEKGDFSLRHLLFILTFLVPLALARYFRSKENQRKYRRYKVQISGLLLDAEGHELSVHVEDFSVGGAGVCIDHFKSNFNLNEKLTLKMKSKEGEWRSISCTAVSNRKNKLGLSFSS